MMKEAKPFVIDKTLIYKAFLKVKENKGSAGVDSVSLEDYEKGLSNRLYKLWNRRQAESNIKLALPLQRNFHRRMNDEQKLIRTFVVERTD